MVAVGKTNEPPHLPRFPCIHMWAHVQRRCSFQLAHRQLAFLPLLRAGTIEPRHKVVQLWVAAAKFQTFLLQRSTHIFGSHPRPLCFQYF